MSHGKMKHRVGIIGAGFIGMTHARAFTAIKDTELTAVADVSKEMLAAFTSDFKIPSYIDYEEMLRNEDLDIVSVCTPHFLHHPMTIRSLESGAHVLCEKPMAMNLGEADEMLKASRKAGREMTVISPRRYDVQYQKARELLENGEIGKLKYIYGGCFATFWSGDVPWGDWSKDYKMSGGGPMMLMAPHTYCLSRYFAGDVEWVMGNVGRDMDLPVEDWGGASLRFKNGVNAALEHNNIGNHNSYFIHLWGTEGQIKVEQLMDKEAKSGQRMTLHTIDKSKMEQFPFLDKKVDVKVEGPNVSDDIDGVWLRMVGDFLESIETGEKPIASAEDGRAAVEMIMAVFESHRLGRRVSLPLKTEKNPLFKMMENDDF